MRTLRYSSLSILLIIVLLGLAACGGGGGAGRAQEPPVTTITISTSTLPDGTINTAYSATVASTCTGTCTWSVSAGALPDGLTLAAVAGNSASATVAGTPSKTGTFTFTVRVANGTSSATKSLTILIKEQTPPTIAISTNTVPNGTMGTAYSTNIASDCTGTCTWSVSEGALPGGLTLAAVSGNTASATISGTPTAAGAFTFTLRVTNGTSTATKSFTITIADSTPTITITGSLPNGTMGTAYSATIASDCAGTCSWSVSQGALPGGLTLAAVSGNTASATISGTPSAAGAFTFTVQVTNGTSTGSKSYTITIQNTQTRNDSIATATPLTNGTFNPSISPYADLSGQANADTDYYVLTAAAGATVQIDVDAIGSTNPMDPVIEIVNSSGQRLMTCQDPGDDNPPSDYVADTTPTAWDDECINDDRSIGANTNSTLLFRPSGTGTIQFFVHVIDWRGDARPDMLYTIKVAGAN